MRAVSWVLTCVVGLLFSQGAGGRAVRMCECIVVHSSAQRTGMRGEAILPEPPGSARGVPARLAWWNGAVAGCSEPRSGRAARACVCVECPAGLLHSC